MTTESTSVGEKRIADIIESAEVVKAPWESLLDAAKADPGSIFEPAALDVLAAVKRDNVEVFRQVRQELAALGCRVNALDDLITKSADTRTDRRERPADLLVALANDAELFHSPDGRGYADVYVYGVRQTWSLSSGNFERWLAAKLFERTGGAASRDALQSAITVLEAKAQFAAPEYQVFNRVAGKNGRLYIDLGDETWRVVEIDETGWRLISNPPVRFRRAAGMKALPVPVAGGSIALLRPFLNVRNESDFVLAVSWLLAAMRDRGPYPILVVSGEHGSAKSTFTSVLRRLIDPNAAPLRTIPVNERDLFISAVNAHVLAYDNLSGMRDWISDALCRVSTGGSFAIRQNYTDQDEVLFDASNPIILNGIEDIIGRPDLADRAVFLRLEPISQELRRPESELWATFDEVYPRIFGALLGGLVTGLQRLPQISMPQLPRMADFAMWSVACETAFWPVGSFWAAYRQNHDEAVEGVVDQDPVATAVRSLMTDRPHWKGTATDLLPVLAGQAGDWSMRSKNWPNSPRQLSGALRRAAPFLREMGIRIDFRREGQSRSRMIYIGLEEFPSNKYSMGTSASSASSAVLANDCSGGETFGYGVGTVPDKVDGDEPLSSIIVRSNAMEPFDLTDADAADEDVGANSETWWSQRI